MVVNSYRFLFFFVVVFIVYYLPVVSRNRRHQNLWLLLVSYIFYGFADIRMIPLLLGSTAVFYLLGVWLKQSMKQEQWKRASTLTTLGVFLGIALLLYFKYLNFFAESFAVLLNAVGLTATSTTLHIVVPVGVSFFTFKLISYLVEIYHEKIDPGRDVIEFATYIAFFPTILSGPIDRPHRFLSQLRTRHTFNYKLAADGCRQILWGMFTKMCIADNLAVVTDAVWNDYPNREASTLLLVALLYLIQMYADFDGYSNMAIGVGKILGFKVTANFNHPLLARDIADYWRRWHMSLTSWITDYVLTPLNLAFRNFGKYGLILAVMINLVAIGFWHGANWTYGLFGFYHGLLIVPLVITGAFGKSKKLKPTRHGLPGTKDLLKMIGTFFLVSFGLIIFRAPSIGDAFSYISGIFSRSLFTLPLKTINEVGNITFLFILLLILLEWITRDQEYPIQKLGLQWSRPARYAIYYVIIFAIIYFGGKEQQFIYFQF